MRLADDHDVRRRLGEQGVAWATTQRITANGGEWKSSSRKTVERVRGRAAVGL